MTKKELKEELSDWWSNPYEDTTFIEKIIVSIFLPFIIFGRCWMSVLSLMVYFIENYMFKNG